MKQADLGWGLPTRRTRKHEFLDQMSRVVPWAELVALVAPSAPEGRRCGTPFAVATMLRIDFTRQLFGLSDPAMEEALHDVPQYREFAGLDSWTTGLARESTILRFRHLLEKQKLADQRLVLINGGLRDKGLMLRAGTVVEHPLQVIKRQFGIVKVRYRGLMKNTAQLTTLFALPNLWMVRSKLMGAGA